jgi:hypothetical protein
MSEIKTIYCNGNPIWYKCNYTICRDDTNIINKKFYVDLDEVDTNTFIDVICKNKFANKMPVKNEIVSRFSTYITFKLKNIGKIGAVYAEFLEKKKDISTIGKNYNNMILSVIRDIANETTDYDEKCNVYVDIYDSIVSSSYIGLFPKDSDLPLFSAASLAETFSKEDYQLNFGTKVSGITSASFLTRPICIDNMYFEPVAGSYFTINNTNIKISYLGTEFTEEKFEDLANLRVLLDLEFTPIFEKLYKNKVDFDKFNSFVNFIKSGKEFDTSTKFGFKLSKISVKCEGEKAKEFGGSEGIISRINSIIKAYYPEINFTDITTNNLVTTEEVQDNEFVLKVIMDSAAK